MTDLTGRVALVTGAARPGGIGRETALRLAADGADVACVDIGRPPDHAPGHGVGTLEELDETVSLIRGLGRRAIAVECDVRRSADVEAAVACAVQAFGAVDIVANVAGGVSPGNGLGPLLELREDEWDWVIDLNLKGAWLVAVAAARQMRRQDDSGVIVLIGSEAGRRVQPGFGAYGAAKAGVEMLTRTLAAEVGASGIRVNAIAPGMVITRASAPVRDKLENRELERLRRSIPLQRFAHPYDIASIVSALCSDDLGYITGTVVDATGGHAL